MTSINLSFDKSLCLSVVCVCGERNQKIIKKEIYRVRTRYFLLQGQIVFYALIQKDIYKGSKVTEVIWTHEKQAAIAANHGIGLMLKPHLLLSISFAHLT